MNVLALDTTLGACSAAIAHGEPQAPDLTGDYELRDRAHAESIVPMIESVLANASLGYEELDAIAVTTGPGSFTGVRVGVSVARGLAVATGLPLIGVTSLDVMAHMALDTLEQGPDVLGVAVDARRGEVYLGLYDGKGVMLSDPKVLAPEQAHALLPDSGQIVLAGGGAGHLREVAGNGRKFNTILPELQPDARMLARIAMSRSPTQGPVHPLYLRPPDAKPQAGKALPRQS